MLICGCSALFVSPRARRRVYWPSCGQSGYEDDGRAQRRAEAGGLVQGRDIEHVHPRKLRHLQEDGDACAGRRIPRRSHELRSEHADSVQSDEPVRTSRAPTPRSARKGCQGGCGRMSKAQAANSHFQSVASVGHAKESHSQPEVRVRVKPTQGTGGPDLPLMQTRATWRLREVGRVANQGEAAEEDQHCGHEEAE